MQRALIHVAWSNGRWRVTESGPRNAVSYFGERRDAMDYAAELAQRAGGGPRAGRRPERPNRSRRSALTAGL
jgi:uncharacterized protein DUF2188